MSLTEAERAARDALRARQGAGARYDAAAAPADDLLRARRGTAYFARKLGALTDADLDAPSLRAGWSRRRLIAQVAYDARWLALAVEALRTGTTPAPLSGAERAAQIALGATLPPRALRHLVHHAAIHLDVEWRDLTDALWDAPLRLADGRDCPARATPALRADALWSAAEDLGRPAPAQAQTQPHPIRRLR